MLIGDVVETEIYGPVIVKKVFRSVREMVANGYAIPTGANDTGFQINGKVVFGTRRTYAAAPHDVRGRSEIADAEFTIRHLEEDGGVP